jgi:hypothetical protein
MGWGKMETKGWKEWVYSKVYAKWLWNPYLENYDIVLKVLNWKTARTCTRHHTNTQISQPCFTILGIKFNQ